MRKGWSAMFICLAATVSLSMSACSSVEGNTNKTATIVGTGTVVFKDLEGGFWGIEGDDGKRYNPMNLAKTFQVEGLRVRFEAKPRPDVTGFHMWGSIVQLIRMEKL